MIVEVAVRDTVVHKRTKLHNINLAMIILQLVMK